MAFPLEILRTGIGIADTLTKGVQATVTLERWTGQTTSGTPTYSAAESLRAVVDYKQKQSMTSTGKLVPVMATLTIVGDVSPAINPKDRITLPDGRTGPILGTPAAVVDPETGRGLITEVSLGA